MPIIDNYYDDLFESHLVKKSEGKAPWNPGQLSASMLAEPLQWQVLKMYGFERIIPPYLLRKFKRGQDVEKELLDVFKEEGIVTGFQKEVNYRGVAGHMDALIDSKGSVFNKGVIPFEIKSVSNAKFKRLMKENTIQRGHALQAALYGLAEGAEWFGVCYISTDDYRLLTILEPVAKYKDEIDKVIDSFNASIITGVIPVFDPPEKWMANKAYNKFPDWAELDLDQCQEKLKGYLKTKNL